MAPELRVELRIPVSDKGRCLTIRPVDVMITFIQPTLYKVVIVWLVSSRKRYAWSR